MKQSIENIWKDGFLKGEALVAPKVNDLYNKKSIHIIDKFRQGFKVNIWAIVSAATLLLVGSYFAGALIAGSVLFVTLMYIAYTAKIEMDALDEIDKGQTSYNYLVSFRNWVNRSIEKYGNMYRFVYPILILSFYFGLWFSDIAEVIREKVVENSGDLIFGVHPYSTILVMTFAIVMGFFAKRIHREDVKFLYGGILQKLEEALTEMEALREGN